MIRCREGGFGTRFGWRTTLAMLGLLVLAPSAVAAGFAPISAFSTLPAAGGENAPSAAQTASWTAADGSGGTDPTWAAASGS